MTECVRQRFAHASAKFGSRRTASSNEFAAPHVNVDLRKQRQVARAARAYRRMFGLLNQPYRYDVVTVVTPARDATREQPQVELLKNFWTDEKLRKRTWQKARWD